MFLRPLLLQDSNCKLIWCPLTGWWVGRVEHLGAKCTVPLTKSSRTWSFWSQCWWLLIRIVTPTVLDGMEGEDRMGYYTRKSGECLENSNRIWVPLGTKSTPLIFLPGENNIWGGNTIWLRMQQSAVGGICTSRIIITLTWVHVLGSAIH